MRFLELERMQVVQLVIFTLFEGIESLKTWCGSNRKDDPDMF